MNIPLPTYPIYYRREPGTYVQIEGGAELRVGVDKIPPIKAGGQFVVFHVEESNNMEALKSALKSAFSGNHRWASCYWS